MWCNRFSTSGALFSLLSNAMGPSIPTHFKLIYTSYHAEDYNNNISSNSDNSTSRQSFQRKNNKKKYHRFISSMWIEGICMCTKELVFHCLKLIVSRVRGQRLMDYFGLEIPEFSETNKQKEKVSENFSMWVLSKDRVPTEFLDTHPRIGWKRPHRIIFQLYSPSSRQLYSLIFLYLQITTFINLTALINLLASKERLVFNRLIKCANNFSWKKLNVSAVAWFRLNPAGIMLCYLGFISVNNLGLIQIMLLGRALFILS